jgi:hypothetical protein
MRPDFRAAATLVLILGWASAWAQKPDDAAPAVSAAQSTAKQGQPPHHSDDDAMLARAAKLYYSTKATGLTGFDCTVHPDWVALIQSSAKNDTVTDRDTSVQLLKSVAISLHARLNGPSNIDWVQPSNSSQPLDQASEKMLEQMHQATNQTIQGFLQFWTPFVDGSVVPASSKGYEVSHSPSSFTLHAKQPVGELTEVFSNDLILQKYDVTFSGNSVTLVPSYDSTDNGLLVSRFVAHVRPHDQPADKTLEMNVDIFYRTVEGFPIPSRLNIEVVGTGAFNFVLEGCRVNPAS